MQSIQNYIAFKNESSHGCEKWIFETFVGFEVFLKEARIPPLTKEKWPSAVYPVAGITAGYRVENRVFIIKLTRIKTSELFISKFDPVMKPYIDQNC